jgi:hypothetical protein
VIRSWPASACPAGSATTNSSSQISVAAYSSPSVSGSTAVNAQSSSSGAQPREQVVLRVLDHVHRDAGVALAELRKEVGEVVRARRVHAADAHLAAHQPGQLLQLAVKAVDLA